MKDYMFSIVMPIYNCEKYLEVALDSVLSQTYKNFELILVDDASSDSSSKICDDYAKQFRNVKAVHHEANKGASEARNTGIKEAKGTYISFFDGDDYVDSNLLEKVNESLQKNEADCILYGIQEEYSGAEGKTEKTYPISYGSNEVIKDESTLHRTIVELEQKTLYGYPYNKFYKLSIIKCNNLTFETCVLLEDFFFNSKYFEFAKSMNIIDFTPYHYMKRSSTSLTNSFVNDYFKLHKRKVQALSDQFKTWNICDNKTCEVLANIFARYIFSALERNCDSCAEMNHKKRKEFLKKLYDDKLFCELKPHIIGVSYSKILYGALKAQNTWLCLLFARIIYIIKEKMPMLFNAAKQNR